MTMKAPFASILVLGLSLGAAGPSGADPAPAKADKAASAPAKPAAPSPAARGAPSGEATLTGELTCAKCGLHESTSCQNVLLVKDPGGKTVKYYLARNDSFEDSHEKVCGGSAHATVTGRISEEGNKKIITPSAVKVD